MAGFKIILISSLLCSCALRNDYKVKLVVEDYKVDEVVVISEFKDSITYRGRTTYVFDEGIKKIKLEVFNDPSTVKVKKEYILIGTRVLSTKEDYFIFQLDSLMPDM